MKIEVAILGGGVAGLGAAYALVKKGISPIMIEKSNDLGGLASSYKINNFYIERFYHHLFPTDNIIFNLANELRIKNKIIWKKTKMGFYYKNKLYGFTGPLDLLMFKPLSFIDRIRLGITLFWIGVDNSHKNLDKVSAKKWIIKTFGNEIYKKIFEPMLKIKFAMSIDDASAAFVLGRLKARIKSRSKYMASEKLGYMVGGYNEIIKSLYDRIKNKSLLLKNSEILEIIHTKHNYKIKIKKNKKIMKIEAKYVINTLPLEIFSRVAKKFPKKSMEHIDKIKYQAVVCATLGLRKKLSDYYWINISSADLPFHGAIEHTNFTPSKYYNKNNIAYLFNYVTPEHKLWTMKEDQIKKIYLSGLFKMFPHMKNDDVLWFKLSRERYATPIFLKGYQENMEKIENLNNFYFAGSFKIYPHSRNINNVIKTGFDAAENLLKNIQPKNIYK
jgi:protoporphyrinogen oxidase